MRETELVRQCLQLLKLKKIPSWRCNSGAMLVPTDRGRRRFVRFSGAKGLSDIQGILPPSGRALFVECKIPPNKATADQEAFLGNAERAGALALVVTSLAELESALKGCGL